MRTLKKSLSLVLALVMVLGLCVIGSNAAYAQYTDLKDINYADAVEVLTGLGIIEGYPDGSFEPTANVTRAEAAAMITRMMLGREKADKLPIGDVKFNDVPETNWAAKYIAFCANRGIIVGVGNGNFEPSRNVTGTELACMLLRALGYGTMGEYEGKGWDINAVADALYYKVFEDTEVTDFSKPATREETALYVFNTMFVELVGYDVDLNYYRGKNTDFAADVYALDRIRYAQVLANQATGDPYTVVEADGEVINLDIETGLDLVAHEVTVYLKADKEYKDKENNYYWVAYLVQDNSTILDKGAYFGDTYKALVAANKTNKDASLDFDTWVNYVYTAGADTAAVDTGYDYASGLKGRYTSSDSTASYLTGKIILDSEGRPLAYMKTEYTVDQVKKISDDGIILKNDEFGFEFYDPDLAYEGIAKGDYVTVQPVGTLCYLYPTTTAEISVFERWVFVDFAIPYFNFFQVGPSAGLGAVNVPDTEDPIGINAGDKVLFYLDYYGAFFAAHVLERGTLKGVVFVNYAYTKDAKDEYGDTDTTVYVQAVDEEGNEVIYALQDSYTSPSQAPQGVYKVFTNSDGEALLSAVGGQLKKQDGKASYLTKTDNSGTYYVSSDTNVIYINGVKKNMKVKVSKSLASGSYNVYANWTGSSTYNVKTVWVLDMVAPSTGGSYLYIYGDTYGYALNGGSMLIADETTYYFTVYIDGVKASYTFIANEDTSSLGGFIYAKGGFYTYSVNENNVYDLSAVEDSTAMKSVTVTLEKGQIHDGKLYYDADGVKITADVMNVSKAKTADGKKYLTIDAIDDIEALLEDGGTVTVQYLATKSGSNWVPSGTIYVIAATEGVTE